MENGLRLFSKALRYINDKNLPAALNVLLPYAESHPYVLYTEVLKSVDENFRLMAHYMEKGVSDPMRDNMYADMLSQLNKVVRNMRADYRRRNIDFYKDAYSHVGNGMPMSERNIKAVLENFVSDEVMLQLQTEETRADAARDLYSRHYTFMLSLFCYIVTSDLWTKDQADNMAELLLQPTVDSKDVRMILSALMLAAMNNFDINKFSVLVEVYRKCQDEKVRQTALVGWVLSLTDSVAVEEQRAYIDELCADAGVVSELVDLQKQMVFCMNAEKDNAVIRNDIMPTLFKSSNFNVTRLGITEKEEDPMQDILDPEAQDRLMEETEEKFHKMMNMQKSGADIYFGGFAQMKRFPFFYNLLNWFAPFDLNNPDLSKRLGNMNGNKFLANLLESGAFCDSDKYSFAIAMSSIMDKLPANMREVVENKDVVGGLIPGDESSSPAFIRRQILQNLYRFFRLYRWHDQIYNPFSLDNCLFVKSSLFTGTPLETKLPSIGNFLMKRSENELLDRLVPRLETMEDKSAKMIAGYYNLECTSDYEKAKRFFGSVLTVDHDDIKAKTGYAKALFGNGDYAEAQGVYKDLYQINPKKKIIALEYSIVLTKLGLYKEALVILYELSFLYQDSNNIDRIIAWVKMAQKRLDDAEQIYTKLFKKEGVVASDFLNAGYCKWFSGNIKEASNMFSRYCHIKNRDLSSASFETVSSLLEKEFRNDKDMLDLYGISNVDIMLMITITYNKILK